MEYVRDYTMYISIFGMFSFCWFGWAQEYPRSSWRKYIGIASGISLLICFIGVYLNIMNWDAPSVLNEKTSFAHYLEIVYIEFFLAAVGASILMKCRLNNYISSWVAFVVGIHFIALKDIFNDVSLYLLAALLIVLSLLSPFISKKLKVANSAITGIGAGIILFAYALLGLIRYLLSL